MYIGPDGRVYQNKFDSLGHSTKMPGYADEQFAINQRLAELRNQRSEAIDQRQQQALRQQQIDAGDTQNFYNRQKELAALTGQPYGGYGQGTMPVTGVQSGQQRSGSGYGMPMERKETVIDPLVQDAGRLHNMLNKEYRRQRGIAEPSAVDPNDLYNAKAARGDDGFEGITRFINQHLGIKANNVSGIQFSDSDRNNDPLVSLIGDDGNPVKQFFLSYLSNLNNFAGQKTQQYNPGRQVKEPEKLMEQIQAMAQQLAAQKLAGESESVRKKEMPVEIQHQFQQLMKQYRYWKDYLAPNIPSEHHRDARRLFDEHTARRGNPESNYLKDALWEAPWHQLYGAGASMASGADRFFGGDGNNTVSQWLREKSGEQLDNMTPTDVEAMQGWDIEMGTNGLPHLKEGCTWRGFGLNLGGAVGSTLPTMVGGGLAARGFAALGGKVLQASGAAATVKGLDDARRVQAWADRIHKGSHAAGYGLVGGWQVGADSADRAKEVILQASQEELLADPKFQELYRQTYDASGGGDTRAPFQQARELLAEESAKSGYLPGFAVGLLSMGVAGPKMEGIALKARGSRKGNALHGAMTEGLQEFGEGFGGEMAANYGVQQAGLERDLTENALAQGIKGTALGAPVGGGLGLLGQTRNPEANSILQNKLNDLMSQHQTLQDQMQEPHADQTMLTEQLRQNSLAMVVFSYLNHATKQYLRFTSGIEDFIKRLVQHIPDTGFCMIRYYGFLATRVRSKLLPKVYDLLDQPERKAIPIRFPAMMKSSFGIDPLECILCKSRMVLTGIVPGKNMTELRQCHERLALNRPIALV